MNRQSSAFVCLTAASFLAAAPLALADEPNPAMHMHKSDMDHRGDKEAATEYKSEATQLREKAESHRNLAKLYTGRTPSKGGANYANVVKHCEQLAKYYEDAAKEADGVASELAK
jgi:hypothetical protein